MAKITLNMYDFIFTDNGEKFAKDAFEIRSIMNYIIDAIVNRDQKNIKFGEEERKCLLVNYSTLFEYSYPKLYNTFCEDYLYSTLYPYLFKKLKSIHNELRNAKCQLNGSYSFSQQKNYITSYMNDIYDIYYKFENRNKDDLDTILVNVERAFGILNRELAIKEARIEAGKKYIELLSKLRNLCSETLKSMTIEYYVQESPEG